MTEDLTKQTSPIAREFARDFRTALIGSAVGGVVALVGAALAAGPAIEFIVDVSEEGVGSPALLFEKANEENSSVFQMEFQPPELQEVFVCEFSILKGDSYRDIVLDYFEKYSSCFSVTRTSEFGYLISTRRDSLDIIQQIDNGSSSFWCKCPTSVSGSPVPSR